MTAWVQTVDERDLVPGRAPQGRWKRYVSGEGDGRGMVFGLGSLAPGESVTHSHVEEEVFYVLRGRGEAEWEVDGITHRAELNPGAAFYKTSHIPHTIRCSSDEPLLGIYCKI